MQQSTTRYVGRRTEGGAEVTKVTDAGEGPLDPRLDLWNHSPTGLEFGYPGSGPAQTALAILADAVGDELAVPLHQEFKRAFIATAGRDGFELSAEEVAEWANARRAGLNLDSLDDPEHP
ncbi:MAG: DUF6166 domain-containing protein [Gemmataceae bacterium]